MSGEAAIEFVRQWVDEVWNGNNLDGITDFHPLAFDNHGSVISVEEARQWHVRNRAAFPDVAYRIDDIFVAGDRVALRWTATATHLGALWNMIPATGKTIRWNGIHMLRIADRRIVEVWGLADTIAQLQQMGVALQPPAVEGG